MIANNRTITQGEEESAVGLSESLNAKEARKRRQAALPLPAYGELQEVSGHLRETGDQVNGFLLCTLVSESAKRIKRRAERSGASLPMGMITRAVLHSYYLAAKDHYGPFAKAELDVAGIQRLNEKVLAEVLARHTQDKVKTVEAQRARQTDEERSTLLNSHLHRSSFPSRLDR